ncbi:hypothetical protein ALC62_00196, partial [Cyphomyrmex costatus]
YIEEFRRGQTEASIFEAPPFKMHYAGRRSTIGRRDEHEQKGKRKRERKRNVRETTNENERREGRRNPGGSWLLRQKRKRKRAKRRAAEFKEPRENGVNKIFPLVRVKARPHQHARSKEMERETEVARPIEGVWDWETRCGGRGRSGPFEGRERVWNAAVVPERERKRSERGTSPVKGKDEDRRKSQWPAKVCCPFVTRERVVAPAVGTRNCVVGLSTENEICVRCRELNAISVYPTTRHASSIADSGDANAIKRLASRFSLATE